MYFKLGIHLFSRKSFMNIMLIILISISFLLTNMCLGMFNERNSLMDSVQNFDKENDCYFMYNTQSFFDGSNFKEPTEADFVKDAGSEKLKIGYVYSGTSDIDVKQSFNTYLAKRKYVSYIAFDNYTINCLNYGNLISGEWCTEAKHKDGYLNVVALDGSYNVGDTFELKFLKVEEETESYIDYEGIYIPCIVTGILKNGSHIYNSHTSGNGISLSTLMPETFVETSKGEKSVIYFSYEDETVRELFKDDKTNKPLLSNCFLHFDDTLSEQEIFEIKENLGNSGWLLSIQDICDNSEKEITERVIELVPFMFGVFLLTVICLICMITLNSMDHMKTYAVYYLCGMNWNDMKKIMLSYSSIIMSFSTVLFGLVFAYTITLGKYANIILLKSNNLFVTLGMLLIIILIFVFVPYILLVRMSPKDALRENMKS